MKSGKARYQEMVRKALEYARSQPEGEVTVARVAVFCGCSTNHLRRIFRLVTGTGVLQNLRHIRLEKAKDLLRHSSLNVTEVAMAAGFSTHSAFTNVFRRATGTTPSEFRKRRQEEGAGAAPPPAASPRTEHAALVFRDDLATGPLARQWTPAKGQWAIAEGCLSGSGDGVWLHLETPLPEDFRLDFELRIVCPTWSAATITLQDGKAVETYCSIELPRRGDGQGVFKLDGRDMLANPEAVLEPATWQTLRLELIDNRFSAWLNGNSIFTFRDLFPPNYSRRNRIAIGAYPATLSLRNVRLYELESAPVVPTVRQGDALFNAGLFQQARDFYLRHLRPDLPPGEEMELRFKIALCLLHEGGAADCRGWVHGILQRTKDSFWLRECNLLLLQLDATVGDTAPFERHARSMLRDPLLWDGIRPIVADYHRRLRAAGFLDRALRVAAISVTMEKGRPDADFRARTRVANILKNTRRFKQAEQALLAFARPSPLTTVLPHARPEALVHLCDMHLMRGHIGEARKLLSSPPLNSMSEWRDQQEAVCLRAERRFPEAVASFLALRARHPANQGSSSARADLQAAELLCCLGEMAEARQIVARVIAESPDKPFPADPLYRGFLMASHLASIASGAGVPSPRFSPPITTGLGAGRLQSASLSSPSSSSGAGVPSPRWPSPDELIDLLLADARRDDEELSLHGQDMVTAGILRELGGKPEEARTIWAETGRRFPPDRCYFWGPLAKALAAGKPDHLETMNLFWTVRSEMFFLAGLLYEHRGDVQRAQKLFKLSLKEDPTLRWPALQSERKLCTAGPALLSGSVIGNR